nr:retrovirus-related Pol polyprotein from transposon TNT 1-94 [Tanacetum cinerariifolium]
GNPQLALKDKGVIDSGCSRNMTGNMSYLSDFEELNGGYVVFGGNPKGGKISGKGVQDQFATKKAGEEIEQQYVHFPVWSFGSTNPQNTNGDAAFDEKEPEFDEKKHESEVNVSPSSNAHTNTFSAVAPSNLVASLTYGKSSCIDTSQLPNDPDMLELEDMTYSDDEDDVGAEGDFNNLETSITVSPSQTTRVHKDHHVTQIIGGASLIQDAEGLGLIDFPYGKRAIGHTQEERIDYEEVFAPVARIEAIRLFLAYASFMGFMVYQMDVKSAFLYGTI